MSDFAATYGPLIEQVRAARAQDDEHAARLALEVLILAYIRLGNRELGTVDEQNHYIVGRHMGVLPDVLQELGLRPGDVPMPPDRRRITPPPPAAAADDIARIGEHLARIASDGQDAGPAERFTVAYRPQDGMRYEGRPAPHAVVDTRDGLPVAWYPEQHWAESTADTANLLRSPTG